MTDFSQSFGDCILMIRDLGPGQQTQFFIYAYNQDVNYGFVQFERVVNGVNKTWQFGLAAHSGWNFVAWDIAYQDQFVTFQLDTNLGIAINGRPNPGYPYNYTIHVARPLPPDPPSRPNFRNVTVNSVDVTWSPGYDGGATIIGYQLGYGTNPNGPTTIINANPGITVGNLATGTVYYFWVKAQNYQGWSNWSYANNVRTYLGAYVNVGGAWKLAVPYVNVGGVWKKAEPHINVGGNWK